MWNVAVLLPDAGCVRLVDGQRFTENRQVCIEEVVAYICVVSDNFINAFLFIYRNVRLIAEVCSDLVSLGVKDDLGNGPGQA